MSLDDLAARQKETGDEIKRIASNYRKDSSSRKTLENLTTRLKDLDKLWADFEEVDNEIRINHGSHLNHPYFLKEYYQGIKIGYEETRQDILDKMRNHQAKSSSSCSTGQNSDQRAQSENITDSSEKQDTSSTIANDKLSTHKDSKRETTTKQGSTGIVIQLQSLMQGLKRMIDNLATCDSEHSIQFYQLKIKAIEKHWDQIQQCQNKLLGQWSDSFEGINMDEYFQLEEHTHERLIQLHDCLRRCQAQSGTNDHSATVESNTKFMMKLPKVELPKFAGDYLKWRQFRDLFTELVHNQSIAACQKMWYLKSSLTGEAEKLVRHLTISEVNYTTAWKLINDRYENTRLLVTALLNKLLSQPVASTEGANAIKMMHDTTQECLLALENLGIKTDNWDPLMLHILIKKLDKTTHTLWEQSLSQPRSLASMKEFINFLENRFQALEALGNAEPRRPHTQRSLMVANCPSCNSETDHQLFACQKFLQLVPSKRVSLVKRINACLNCLKKGHIMANCPSRGCTKCGKKHNTLLHIQSMASTQTSGTISRKTEASINTPQTSRDNQSSTPPSFEKPEQSISLTAKTALHARNYVLLSTAIVKLTSNRGTSIECRAILDSGSQLNFITERLVKRLGLSETPEMLNIEGIGLRRQRAQKRVNVLLESRINGFHTRLEAHVLPRIISAQPSQVIDISTWSIPSNIQLADPHFNQPEAIDLLIGAELYYSILAFGQINLGNSLPTLQNTVFGWTAAGSIHQTLQTQATCGVCSEDETLNQQLERFWILDDLEHTPRALTSAERRCETYFVQTTQRTERGRFIVKLPFKNSPTELGESKNMASQRFQALERRLAKDNVLREQYIKFMQEYIALGHMEEVNFHEINKPYNFLPHHCVIKPESTTTKLRVVFDASAKTSTNVSLNDILATGPSIQEDVFSILLRFRMPRFVFTADIEKMYRQIQVHDDDRKYQLIWWRNNPTDPLKCYKLCTVTYGMTCAPYLAMRSLQMLAEEGAQHYPLGAEVLKRDFYVDDVLTGADSLTTAVEMQIQLQTLLESAGFKLRKWCANHPNLLKNIPQQDQELQLDFGDQTEDNIKAVGLTWLPKSDELCIKTSWINRSRITKRSAYSDIAHIFDPLGIMGPVVVIAKIFLQKLWALKCDWDAALPQELHSYWLNFREGLKILNNMKFPRHVFSHKNPQSVQIHIFADASERAYGAAAYIRSVDKEHIVSVRLLCAKSRVAPIKQTTIPRLELCAAKLAAELAHRLKGDLNIKNIPIFLWSDSEIVLAWINSSSSSYQTFVANRVSVIQQLTVPEQWRHVGSKDNPADILSRGISPERLGASTLWFYGPRFLHGSEVIWPAPYTKKSVENDIERKQERIVVSGTASEEPINILRSIDHKNSFRKAQRIISYMFRFIRHTRRQNQYPVHTRILNVHELDEAQTWVIRSMQDEGFKGDYEQLRRFGEVSKNSSLSSLAPFIDKDGIIRVGGRLEASNLSYQTKHPMLLPYSHQLTKSLLNDIHKENSHVGPQTLLAIARQTIWPIKGKTLARSVVQNCVQCAKSKPKLLTQLMGNLPADRVQPARPFVNSGVDFCGPIWTHFKVRGKKPQKSYIAVFCCFATKASHLEVVSDLSTQGFLGALRRFMARRGHCKTIYCDNATNFVGAKNLLKELKDVIECEESQNRIIEACSSKAIEFRFIPPRTPHFGGLWEAAVKSAKHLLQRTLASASLTYEELETAVIEIEAILNSRPITPMSSDPNDLTALTPGHFLIGEPLTSTIDSKAEPLKANLITRWKLVSHIKNEFWRRWTIEYLSQLQHRYKWKQQCENVKLGTMVLVKEDNTPALKWPLGRIVNAIKGYDGLVRVVDIRTSSGIIRRPIHRVAPLPIETEPQNNSVTQHDEDSVKTNSISASSDTREHSSAYSDTPTTSNEDVYRREATNPRKKQRTSLGSAIVTLLLACLIIPSVQPSPIEVKPFTHQPGIYFENLGAANIVTNEWNLVVFYDMTLYWKEYNLLQNCTMTAEKLCQRINESEQCSGIIAQLKHLLTELDTNNMLLSETDNSKRTRRGAVNFIGNIASSLFGVLDSEYAEKMSQTINDIKLNENHLLDLIKNQTSIMDATLNIMKKEEQSIDNQFQQLEVYIERANKQITNWIQEELYQEKLSQAITSITMSAMLTASNLFRIQSAIINVITDTHHGKISPLLISPAQLRQELLKVKTHLPPSLRLPIQQDETLKYYTLMTIEGRAVAQHIIFKIRLPLLALEEFELFKITPVPVLINNTFVTIKPSFPFLVINLHRDQYYPLTEQELQLCTVIEADKHLCKQKHPIYRKGSSVSACEINFINQLPQSSTYQVVKIEDGPHWIQLYSPNQWIYALAKKTTINVVCDENTTQQIIEGSGILTIQDRCIIKQPLITIQGHSIYPSNARAAYIPISNLTTFVLTNKPTLDLNYSRYHQSHVADINAIRKELRHFNDKLSSNMTPHDIHQFSVGYGAILFIIVITIYLIWKFGNGICPRRPREGAPVPAPRQHRPSFNTDFNTTFDD